MTGGTLSIDVLGELEIATAGATLVGVTVDIASGGSIQVDGSDTLTLSGTTITGGTITDNGTISTIGAQSAIDNVTINNSAGIIALGGTLTLDDTTINGGTITGNGSGPGIVNVDTSDTLTLNGVTTFGQGTGTIIATVDNAGTIQLDNTLTINGGPLTFSSTASARWCSMAIPLRQRSGETLDNEDNTFVGRRPIGTGTTSI